MAPDIRQQCYTADWRRTCPDLAVHLPQRPCDNDSYNDHFLVTRTPGEALLAVWTQGSFEGARDLRVVFSRSEDGGESWSEPQHLPGADDPPGLLSCFGFPVVSRSGRIYCFYNKNLGIADGGAYYSGPLRCAYSDDDGIKWCQGGLEIPYRRTRFDHPDPAVSPRCIVWQKPIRDGRGRQIVGFTRWSSFQVFPRPKDGYHFDSSCELMRFDNIDEGPDPHDIEITWLPEQEGAIRVPCPLEPERSRGYSLCEEPSLALLPDGTLFSVMRTLTGRVWLTISQDHGLTWRTPQLLRYRDGGEEVLHPKSPCPLYALADGRFLLLFHNHDGFAYGARGPWDTANARRPLFVTVGAFQAGADQPIWFGPPRLLFDSQGVAVGSEWRIWLSMYASLTEVGGRRILWYPDRKHFLLGRVIDDAWLAGTPDAGRGERE